MTANATRAPTVIPAPLISLLGMFWESETATHVFDEDWAGDRNKYLRVNPAFHGYSLEPEDPSSVWPFETKEVAALYALPLFAGLIGKQGAALHMNAHAENAVVDFCKEAYAAYAKLQIRLAAVCDAQLEPPPGVDGGT